MNSKPKTWIYRFPTRGLFSELTGLLNTAFYALNHQGQVSIDDRSSPLYFSEGFDAYFEPIEIPEEHMGATVICELGMERKKYAKNFQQIRNFAIANCGLYQRRFLASTLVLNKKTRIEGKRTLKCMLTEILDFKILEQRICRRVTGPLSGELGFLLVSKAT